MLADDTLCWVITDPGELDYVDLLLSSDYVPLNGKRICPVG